MISDVSFWNHVTQKTSHSFQFEDSYDSLCYEFFLEDNEKRNLKLKNQRSKRYDENCMEHTKPLIGTKCLINCPEIESTDVISTLSTPILNIESRNETEESLEEPFW